MVGASLGAALIIAIPAPAFAKSINVPAGTVGQAAFAIGRQAGVSIAVPDSAILKKRTPAIRGQKDASGALMQLARSSDLQVRKVGSNSYVLLAAPRRAAPRKIDRKAVRPRGPAELAPGPDINLEDIVVTASKRDTPSRRFAGAWSRIEGEEFTSLGVRGADAIESRSVGFSSTHLGSGRNKLFIRGIADSSFSGPTQSPVGQYFGDVRTGYSGADPDLKLVDMKSVEILEGPQSTLYGSGALGGIVVLKPNMPVFGERSGAVASGASITKRGDMGHDTSGVLNFALGDRIAFRAVGYRALEGGYIDNLSTGHKNINDVRVTGGRATMSASLGGDWFVDVGGTAQRIKGDDSQYSDRDGQPMSRTSEVEQPFSSDFGLANLVVRKDDGDIRFRSTTAASRQDVEENFDATLSGEARVLRQHSEGRALSNETRIWRPMDGGFSWLAGFSTIAHRYAVSRDLVEESQFIDLAGAENRVRETTFFGEAGVELTRWLEATVGGRYTTASLSGSGQHLSPVTVFPADAKRKESSFLPSASLLARPLEGLTVYGRYQEGFRPGGISIAGDLVTLYRNDHLRTAEVGFRFGQAGRTRFDVQGSATISGWKNIQADFLDASGLPVTDNIGDGRVWTVTANGGAQLTDDLRLEAGLAWNDGKITRIADNYRAAWTSLAGPMTIPNIAKVVARGAIDWRTGLGGDWALHTNLYARYVGRSRLGVGPQLGDEQGQYLDSGLLFRLTDGQRAWTLNVTNLADEVGNRFAFGAPIGGSDQITPLRPRTIRLGFEQGF